MRRSKQLLLGTVLAGVLLLASGCGRGDTILIGAQTFSEPKILAQMYKLLIEDRTDLKVDVLPDLATSPVVLQAMKNNDVQMGTLYSGEIFNNHFPIEDTKERQRVLEQAQTGFDKYYGLKWYDPLGFENTYAFTVRKDIAEKNHYKKISDLNGKTEQMKLGVDTSWLERTADGYPAFQKHYNMTFGKTLPMEVALVYKAVASEEVDIVLAYTTDARLKEYDLQTLEDDKKFFPPFDASPVVRKDLLEKHPEINDVLQLLIGKIDAETMVNLNYEVDVNKRNERKVAEEYLQKVGLLKQ